MSFEVVVLAEGRADVLARWHADEVSSLSSGPWEELALLLVRRARGGTIGLAEVFFCMQNEDFLNLNSSYSLLETLCNNVHAHNWGAPLYVVIEPCHDGAEYSLDTCMSLCKGLSTLLRSRVDDVLETKMDLTDQDSLARLLRVAADRSRVRSSIMQYPHRVVEAGDGADRHRMLLPLLEPFRSSPTHLPLAVVVCHPQEKLQRLLVEQTLSDHEACEVTVISLRYEAKSLLKQYCDECGFNLLEVRGPIELSYLLTHIPELPLTVQRESPNRKEERGLPRETTSIFATYDAGLLRMARHIGSGLKDFLPLEQRLRENIWRTERYGDTSDLRHARSEIIDHLNGLSLLWLRIDFNTLCRVDSTYSPATFLVTHSFDPESDRDQCLLAARLLDLIRQEAPVGSTFSVHLAVARQSLCAMIQAMEPVNIWIFLGPADGPRGLQEASPPHYLEPEQWRACFRGKEGEPFFALFIAGRSTETASHFAQSGATCSVGFGVPRIEDGFRHSIPRIVRAILREGSNPRSLAVLLNHVSQILSAFGFEACTPRVFNPDRP